MGEAARLGFEDQIVADHAQGFKISRAAGAFLLLLTGAFSRLHRRGRRLDSQSWSWPH
jgi:hypothetical protein